MARGEGYYGGGGALGITNPFAQNIPNLADIDKAISEIEHNRLVGEDLRSQIAERAANVAWQQQADDYGGVPGVRNGAAPAAAPASGGAATLAPYVPRNLPPGVTPEEDLRVRTAYGEAGGEGARGQQAVNSVLSNRVAQSGRSLSDVIFAPGQFEPWNNPTTRAKLEALDPSSPEYQTILANLRAGKDGDPTGGATHFYSPKAQAALGRQPPGWGNAEPSAVIGGHNFYRIGYAPGGGAPGAFPGTATAAATPVPPIPPPAPPPARTGPGVAGRIPGAYDVSGDTAAPPGAAPGGAPGQPGGGPQFTSAAEAAALGSAGRALLNMPEDQAAAAYPGMVKELQASGFALGAPPTYPGHAGIQHLAEAGQPGQGGTAAPYAVAGQTVPPPTPPEPTNERGLTASDIRTLQQIQHSKGATPATVAQAEMTLRQRNQAAQEAYRTNLEQQQQRTETLGHTQREEARQARLDAIAAEDRAAKKAAADAEAANPYHGTGMDPQVQNLLDKGDDGSARYARAYTQAAAPKYNVTDGSWQKPNMSAYDKPSYIPKGMTEAPDYTQQETPKPTMMNTEQTKAAGFADRIQQTLPVITDTSPAAMNRWQVLLGKAPLGNSFVSPEFQMHQQSERNFINATLRRESGMAISESEFANARQQYIPQPGDGAAVLAQKKQNRETLLHNIQRDAGPAYKPEAAAPTPESIPGAAIASLKEGQETTFGNGQVWTLQGGNPVKVR